MCARRSATAAVGEILHVRSGRMVYGGGVRTLGDQLAEVPGLNRVVVPDLWQQAGVNALRAGKDVVVHAPTGAGKTLIFELWSNQGKNRGQAIYTVPTRALANDKLAEWRARGWAVGIATGDLAENLEAPVVVATLETQKHRLIRGEGPALLVVDEYQMLADPQRGLNYELALALAPPHTQLLLLSGSVGNPQDVVKWLQRLGREAVLVRSDERPVPLEEVYAHQLSYHLPSDIRGYWPRLAAKALAEGLGPILFFAPRRQAAEALAAELAAQLPNPHPLMLNATQKLLVGDHLAKLLKGRVAYHHSGLSYGARAGVVEPLAKAGQLRAVVATMGLAAGINFSLRSVALAGDSYRREALEHPLKPDEILQMFGRAGRRGIDETGYVLITANEIRLLDAHACHLTRNGMVDWSALLGLMRTAAHQGRAPFLAAVEAQERLFTTKPICLGVETSLKHQAAPCGLMTDAERARHVRRWVRELRNSRGEWERYPAPVEKPLAEVVVPPRRTDKPASPAPSGPSAVATAGLPGTPPDSDAGGNGDLTDDALATSAAPRPVLSEPAALEKVGVGTLCVVETQGAWPIYGRALTVAERLPEERVILAKWVRRLTNWKGRQASLRLWQERIVPLLERGLVRQHTPLVRLVEQGQRVIAQVSLAALTMRVPVDRHHAALWRPEEREVLPSDCAQCAWVGACRQLPTATGTALLWRRLNLVEAAGVPTRRGEVVSFFSQSDGLALAAALEEEDYPVEELLYDLANLDAGFRFCGDENRWGGRLARACQRAYGNQSIPGYLENGVPPEYGAGAEVVMASVHKNPLAKHSWANDLVGVGDIDRLIIEWRSLLRQIVHAPDLEWPRWRALQRLAKATLRETESPTLVELPPLEYHQTRRLEHHLLLRRH